MQDADNAKGVAMVVDGREVARGPELDHVGYARAAA